VVTLVIIAVTKSTSRSSSKGRLTTVIENSSPAKTAPASVPKPSIIKPLAVRNTSHEEVMLVMVETPRNSAKIMCDRKFQNRKKITITAAIEGIWRSFWRNTTRRIPAMLVRSPRSSRWLTS
jgi:hypothetical protein